MPRPDKFTEEVRRRKLRRRPKAGDDENLEALPGKTPLLPFEDERGDHAHRLRAHLGIRASHDLASELGWLLKNIEHEWHLRRDHQADPSLPNLGGVQPTADQMRVTIADGARHARGLREWSRSLPAALFRDVAVLIPGDPPLRAAIEHVAHTFDRLSRCTRRRAAVGRPDAVTSRNGWAMADDLRLPTRAQYRARPAARLCARVPQAAWNRLP